MSPGPPVTAFNECKTYGGTASMDMLMADDRVTTIGNYASAHQFSYIPGDLYETHPEYYAEIDGKRPFHEDPNERSYCLTHEGFVQYFAKMIRPSNVDPRTSHFIGLGHADNANYCQCPRCKASYDRVDLAGTYMEFDNKIAERITQQHPNIIFTTLAYGITFAPTPVLIHPSIRPIWCPISCCHAHGFDECDANRDRQFLSQLAQWQKNTSRIGIWYYHSQSDSLMPHMKMHATAKDFKSFKQMGVNAIFVEDNCGASIRDHPVPDGDKLMPAYGNADRNGYFSVPFGLNHLRSYLACRMLWDVDFDWKEGVRDFCNGYYGPAGEDVAKFALMVESLNTYDLTLGTAFLTYDGVHQSGCISPKLKSNSIATINALFEGAVRRVKSDRTLRRRGEMARASADLAILCFTGPDHPLRQPAFDRFFH